MIVPYKVNNIDFRIVSADAIGRFKTNQASALLQVNRKEFDFDVSSREVVLLAYDRFFNWLTKVERMFLDEHQREVSRELVQDVYCAFAQELLNIEQTCEENPTIFHTDITGFLKVIHGYATEDMRVVFNERVTTTIPSTRAFQNIVASITDYLQHILLSMHEFNNNILLKREPFLCIGHYTLLPKPPGFNSIRQRAEYFRTSLERYGGAFLIKNYTSEDLAHPVIMSLWDMGIAARPEELALSM